MNRALVGVGAALAALAVGFISPVFSTGITATTSFFAPKAGDGTFSAPSYSFASDVDTGLYRSASNETCLSAGGGCVLKTGTAGVRVPSTYYVALNEAATTKFTDNSGVLDVVLALNKYMRFTTGGTANVLIGDAGSLGTFYGGVWFGSSAAGAPTNNNYTVLGDNNGWAILNGSGSGSAVIRHSNDSAKQVAVTSAGGLTMSTTDSTGTPGAATINKMSGKSAIAAGASTVVITNSLVTASSQVHTTISTNDSTCNSIDSVVPAAGSFTIRVNANCTAATNVSWFVTN